MVVGETEWSNWASMSLMRAVHCSASNNWISAECYGEWLLLGIVRSVRILGSYLFNVRSVAMHGCTAGILHCPHFSEDWVRLPTGRGSLKTVAHAILSPYGLNLYLLLYGCGGCTLIKGDPRSFSAEIERYNVNNSPHFDFFPTRKIKIAFFKLYIVLYW